MVFIMDKRPVFTFQRSPEQATGQRHRHPVIVVGAGPVGLTTAIDLKTRGIPVIVIDDDNTVSEGSRAIAYAQRTLEIWDRLGITKIRQKGVNWENGKVFYQNDLLYEFSMRQDALQKTAPFVNLQQYYVEEFLVERCQELGIEIRWETRLTDFSTLEDDAVLLSLDTPEGSYETECNWLIAADGARSQIRRIMGIEFRGQVFDERFLIADIRMLSDYPAERWFWFDPPFNPGQSALLHMQADNIWRVGMQLGVNLADDFDVEFEKSADRVIPRIRTMLGQNVEFELEWASIYTFQCRRLENFVHGRVLFVGDSAHQVSPFGGRGANSGVQDADNLVWKLALVIKGQAPVTLLDTYSLERGQAADENILNSTRATDFITPKNSAAVTFRNAVLALAKTQEFARPMVNSGRLSVASTYLDSPLSTPDSEVFNSAICPGFPCVDVPLTSEGKPQWILDLIGGEFCGILYADPALTAALSPALQMLPEQLKVLQISPAGSEANLVDQQGIFASAFDAKPGTFYLVRPDQHVAARWRSFDADAVITALDRSGADIKENTWLS